MFVVNALSGLTELGKYVLQLVGFFFQLIILTSCIFGQKNKVPPRTPMGKDAPR